VPGNQWLTLLLIDRGPPIRAYTSFARIDVVTRLRHAPDYGAPTLLDFFCPPYKEVGRG